VSIVHQVLSLPDIDEVLEYANERLGESEPNEQERMFKSWQAKWRKEALEHYLKLGWSFIARDEKTNRTVGFFLAQPFLFFRGQTQTLWVEHVEADDDETKRQLVDVAVRVAREKHLQRVLFAEANEIKDALQPWHPEPLSDEPIAVVKTTKG
jgi:hypothetical protein